MCPPATHTQTHILSTPGPRTQQELPLQLPGSHTKPEGLRQLESAEFLLCPIPPTASLGKAHIPIRPHVSFSDLIFSHAVFYFSL